MDNENNVSLTRSLGLSSIILLGVGAILGGGIFTLLGPATSLVGPGLFLAMILGAGVAFLNLQMYIALGTTFPEVGGGFLWVKKGLGNFQGFLSGWVSWFAHASAAGLYALSFGFYLNELFHFFGRDFGYLTPLIIKLSSLVLIIVFGYLNWRGTKTSGYAGNFITTALLIILGLFIVFGIKEIASYPDAFINYAPLLPSGLLGILAAASFFYIAFAGSEIQVQVAEEVKNPQINIKRGLISSWAIVSVIYVLIALVIVGVDNWQTVANYGDGAIAVVAQKFMPFGGLLMIVGGLLANIAALNATIFSSSRISFALAKDKNIWSRLSSIHLKNFTPDVAVAISTVIIILMVILLPLLDIAAVASLLFILLFLQLNIAGIKIHFKWPTTKWFYKIPLFPATPILAIIIYIALAITMLNINSTAWLVALFWILLGLINYFAYSETQSRKYFETEILYEETLRIGPKTGKRILLPLSPDLSNDLIYNLTETAFILASHFGGEVIVVKVHEIPRTHPMEPSSINKDILKKEQEALKELERHANEFNQKTGSTVNDINFHGLIMMGRDVVDTLIKVMKMEVCNILLLNWDGYTKAKGDILSQRIDRIMRETNCALLVIKNPQLTIKNILVAVHPTLDNPYLEFTGDITKAISNYYKPGIEVFSVLEQGMTDTEVNAELVRTAMKLKNPNFGEISIVRKNSATKAILDEGGNKSSDMIIVSASRPKFLHEIRFGSIAEFLVKHYQGSVMIVRGHEGLSEDVWRKMLNRLKTKQKK